MSENRLEPRSIDFTGEHDERMVRVEDLRELGTEEFELVKISARAGSRKGAERGGAERGSRKGTLVNGINFRVNPKGYCRCARYWRD
jgi:hypothetical protein